MTHLHTMCDTSEAAVAVTALRHGDMVAWMPGDRTLYRLALDAKARQIGLPDVAPPAPPTRTAVLETLAALDDGELRALLAAVVDAQTTGNGLLAYRGRLVRSPLRAIIYEPDPVEGHSVKLTAVDADGLHLSCSCGWDHKLGWFAEVPDAAKAITGHLASAAPSSPL